MTGVLLHTQPDFAVACVRCQTRSESSCVASQPILQWCCQVTWALFGSLRAAFVQVHSAHVVASVRLQGCCAESATRRPRTCGRTRRKTDRFRDVVARSLRPCRCAEDEDVFTSPETKTRCACHTSSTRPTCQDAALLNRRNAQILSVKTPTCQSLLLVDCGGQEKANSSHSKPFLCRTSFEFTASVAMILRILVHFILGQIERSN